jgi:hypothetical protein
MGDENVEVHWYDFCLIKAVILLFVFLAVALLCKWLLRRIPWKSVKRRPVKHAIVHSLGTLRPPRNFDASQSKAIDRGQSERKKRIGLAMRLIKRTRRLRLSAAAGNRAKVMELLLGIALKPIKLCVSG